MDGGRTSYLRFLNGDDSGMEEIIRDYRDGLIAYLNLYLGSAELSEEIAEDTFVLLCIKKPKDKGKSSFKTWLYTIGRNLAIDHLRKKARDQTVSFDEKGEMGSFQYAPEETFFRSDRDKTIHLAMNRLQSEHRRVLWLLYFEGLKYKEISIVMNRSVHAAHMLANRAKVALRDELKKEGFQYEID